MDATCAVTSANPETRLKDNKEEVKEVAKEVDVEVSMISEHKTKAPSVALLAL